MGVASAGNHVNVEHGLCGSTGCFVKLIPWVGLAGSVGGIGVDLGDKFALAQEVKWHLGYFPSSQLVSAANIPVRSRSSAPALMYFIGRPINGAHLIPEWWAPA